MDRGENQRLRSTKAFSKSNITIQASRPMYYQGQRLNSQGFSLYMPLGYANLAILLGSYNIYYVNL
jgi:hypothetical protein